MKRRVSFRPLNGIARRRLLAVACTFLPLPLLGQVARPVASSTKKSGPPLAISRRPFAVEPTTGVMMPDGIFDCSIFRQEITCFIRNTSSKPIRKMWVRPHPRNNPEWTLISHPQIDLVNVAPGSAISVSWLCDFRNSTPGKKPFRIEFGGTYENGQGFDGYLASTIFVSKTTFDPVTKKYTCRVPEGAMEVEFTQSLRSPPHEFKVNNELVRIPALPIPIAFMAVVRSNPGQELHIPFNDPWWKVVAWIVAVVAGIGAILEALKGNGQASVGIGGFGHDNPADYRWCFPDPTTKKPDMTSAGILSAISQTAVLVGMSDRIDPWERGRVASGFAAGVEVPLQETLAATLKYPGLIAAGRAYEVGIDWVYTATTTSGRTKTVSMSDREINSHAVKHWEIDSPMTSSGSGKPIVVRIRGHLPDGNTYRGEDLYAFAEFTSPGANPKTIRVRLLDDGRLFDSAANDSWYTGGIIIENLFSQFGVFEYRGEWSVAFFAQNVNAATPEMPPKLAATFVGGNPVLAPLQYTQEPKACPVDYVRKILVS